MSQNIDKKMSTVIFETKLISHSGRNRLPLWNRVCAEYCMSLQHIRNSNDFVLLPQTNSNWILQPFEADLLCSIAGCRHRHWQADGLHNNWRSTQRCHQGRPCLHHSEPKVHSGEFHAQQAEAPGESAPAPQSACPTGQWINCRPSTNHLHVILWFRSLKKIKNVHRRQKENYCLRLNVPPHR